MSNNKLPDSVTEAIGQGVATIAAVFRKRVPSPILDSFVQRVTIRGHGVWPVWQVVVASVLPVAVGFLSTIFIHASHGIPMVIGLVCSGAVLAYTLHARHKQIQSLSPAERMEFETWDRVRYLRSCVHQGKLYSYVPGPVLEELEAIARVRDTILADVQTHVRVAPEIVMEIHDEVDMVMASAIASSSAVVRSAQQSTTDVVRWENDKPLMEHILKRLRKSRNHMEALSPVHTPLGADTNSLREALSRARNERAIAEKELAESLHSD